MNKYTELSDFEINKKVAERLFLKFTDSWSVILVDGESFDPCNNPADAMPIIIDNKICTAFDVFAEEHDGGNWVASPAYGFANERTRSNNLYRAAMELFLLIKDAENEN
ncbi:MULTISPECIES: phage protein NinX family protein [Providencia]|uniref:phage protein NinX family protein n=1 Tax=Providencia TaxID=586 RepID=UPI00234AAEA4|nr:MULTISPECIES: phage protein NinX family protein [unclassified Providencia]